MKKQRWFALLLALAMFALSACSGGNTTSASDTSADPSQAAGGFDGNVLIGSTVHLTGSNQLAGSYYQNGVRMAVEEINASGGILGKELKIEYTDEGSDPQTAVNACEKLLSMDVMAIVGSIVSTNCKAVLPLIKSAEVPYFALGSNSTMAEEGVPWLWQVRVKDALTAPIMAETFHNSMNVKNPAIIYNTAESTTLSSNAFVAKYKELGIDIPESNIYACNEDETNFGNIISQITSSGKVDGIWCAIVNSSQAMVAAQQISSAGFEGPLMGNSVFSSPEFRAADPAASENWYCVVEWTASLLGDIPEGIPQEAIEFEKRYEARYDGLEAAPYTTQGYDCVYLFKYACEKAGTTEDRAAINKAMESIDYQGAGNKYEYYGENVLTTYILVTQNKEGQAVPSQVVSIR